MITDLDKVQLPEVWPSVPKLVSFSAMSIIESCPRQWALTNAEYPQIWGQHGYPRRVGYAAARGQIVHSSVELLINSLHEGGCSTLRSKEAVKVLKELGGFTRILEEVRSKYIKDLASNPRMDRVLPILERRLIKDAPVQKSIVQDMLQRIDSSFETWSGKVEGGISDHTANTRPSLGMGSHSEVFLKSDEIGWLGIADLISISPDTCEIRDFKTGEEHAYHADQLKTYAVLWYKDKQLNPESVLAQRLTLSYPGHDNEIPAPNAKEIHKIEISLKHRRNDAISALSVDPPEARPTEENCRWCSVKHLCDDYWVEPIHQTIFKNMDDDVQFIDAQIQLDQRRDSLTWVATVDCARGLPKGTRSIIMLQTPDDDLQAGQTIRIVGARTAGGNDGEEHDESSAVFEFVGMTERFWLD